MDSESIVSQGQVGVLKKYGIWTSSRGTNVQKFLTIRVDGLIINKRSICDGLVK